MFPSEAHLVNSSSQMVLLLVSTLNSDLEAWRVRSKSLGSEEYKGCVPFRCSVHGLVHYVTLTSHLTLNLSVGTRFLKKRQIKDDHAAQLVHIPVSIPHCLPSLHGMLQAS